ncbi:hypothetical protein N2152v2_008371 [Parachlorella kessleri]
MLGHVCSHRDTCILQHPLLPGQPSAPASASGFVPGGPHAAGRRRGKVLKRYRAGAFRRWLLDMFGQERLCQGAGVLDVAGGRGELAFELLNLNGIPATVLEPRPLEFQERLEWMLGGFYGRLRCRNQHADTTISKQQPGESQEQQQRPGRSQEQQQQQQQAGHEQKQQQLQRDSNGAVTAEESACLLAPQHLRLAVTPQLAACLKEAFQEIVSGEKSSSNCCTEVGGPASLPAMPESWPAAFTAARQHAQQDKWAQPAAGHGPVEAGGSCAAQREEGQQAQLYKGNAAATLVSRGEGGGSSEAAGPDWGTRGPGYVAGKSEGAMQSLALDAPEVGINSFSAVQPVEVVAAEAAWRLLTYPPAAGGCSAVVGMHPDEATDFIVDLALATNKPFAVVPCCVHAETFPGRQVHGRPVSTYEDLVEYLATKDTKAHIVVSTLPVEGRSRVVYRV